MWMKVYEISPYMKLVKYGYEKWLSQLYSQFDQLQIFAWKQIQASINGIQMLSCS